MSEMQCSTSLEHSYNSVHKAYWFTVFLTSFFIPFLPLFPKKYQLKTSTVGNLTALGSSSENKTKLYEPAQTPFATFFSQKKSTEDVYF